MYGDGHSLGGHIVVNLALKTKTFDNVHGLNDAPINVYQIIDYDRKFQEHLSKSGVNIEQIKEEDLKKEVYSYYSNEIAEVNHIRVKGEPLYSQKFKGSLYVGNITVLGDRNTPEFPDVTQTGFVGLGVLNKAQEMMYNYAINQVIGGLQELDDQLGPEKGPEAVDTIVSNLNDGKYWNAGLEGLNVIGLSNQLQAGLASLMMAPKPLLQTVIAVLQHRNQLENHSISMLIKLFNADLKESYFNFVDSSTGKTVLVEQESIKKFIAKCNAALEQKKLSITWFNNFVDEIGYDIYRDDKDTLLKLMSEKEKSPSAFYNEAEGFWMSLLNGTMIVVDSVVFDKNIRELNNSVFDSLLEAKEIIENEIEHLEKFIEKTLKLGKVAFEKDKELGSLIKRLGV
ncbi:hypothetical protein D1953_15545 [Peribacillus asahii]|uniref:DUF6792 domain-containing protein n=1 Tax=Peribacillus asahii TaxID=228899 RepID=A0A398B729_9BACI|nr:DUF6792 domain-containing protein [Peribacillus asahii]RID83710.1 hypothetical protein D1953_15545 [Peribacillus asahii]